MIEQALLTSVISSFIFLLYWVFKWLVNKIKADKETSNKNNNIIKINNSSDSQNKERTDTQQTIKLIYDLEAIETRLNHLIKAFSLYVENNGSDQETKKLIKKLLDDFI